MIDASDVGRFFVGTDGDVWMIVAYSELPTVSFERVRDGERRGGVVGSPNVSGFERLVPESSIDVTRKD